MVDAVSGVSVCGCEPRSAEESNASGQLRTSTPSCSPCCDTQMHFRLGEGRGDVNTDPSRAYSRPARWTRTMKETNHRAGGPTDTTEVTHLYIATLATEPVVVSPP